MKCQKPNDDRELFKNTKSKEEETLKEFERKNVKKSCGSLKQFDFYEA